MVEGFITLGKSKLSIIFFWLLDNISTRKDFVCPESFNVLAWLKDSLVFYHFKSFNLEPRAFSRNFTWKYAVWVITGFHKESDSTWCKKKFMSDVMPEQAGLGRLSCRDCVLSYLWRIVLYLLKKSYKHFTEYIQQWSSPQSNIHMGPTPVLLPCRPLWDKAFSICEKGFIGLVVLNHKNTDHVILIMIELNSLYTSSYNILSYWVV